MLLIGKWFSKYWHCYKLYRKFRNNRIGSTKTAAAGKEIGVARIYDFALESGSYSATNADANVWDASLFDIQTYTSITLNQNVTLSTPTHIKGKASGATGF